MVKPVQPIPTFSLSLVSCPTTALILQCKSSHGQARSQPRSRSQVKLKTTGGKNVISTLISSPGWLRLDGGEQVGLELEINSSRPNKLGMLLVPWMGPIQTHPNGQDQERCLAHPRHICWLWLPWGTREDPVVAELWCERGAHQEIVPGAPKM